MHTPYNTRSEISTTAPWRPGVRARLLLAFLAITGFTALAAVAGIYAFREVGERLDVIDERVAPAIAALELSRSAERIIAAAPALLAAGQRQRRDEVRAELDREVDVLEATLADLSVQAGASLPLDELGTLVSSLTAELDRLDSIVGLRIDGAARVGTLRDELFDANAAVRRLLAPWLEVLGSEIAARVNAQPDDPGAARDETGLAARVDMQRRIESVQRHVSTVVDRLGEASTATRPERLPVLRFQVELALGELADAATGLDPRLAALLEEQVAALGELAAGAHSIPEARGAELALIAEGERRLAETTRLSAELSRAVDRLAEAAKSDAAGAVASALGMQETAARVLVALALLGVVTALLIVWRYVGGNIVRRLTALSDRALAIAGGRLSTPVEDEGSDEIAAMARAVETFRRNAVELERLLAEREQTATRLESIVAERTRDLSDKTRQLEVANRYKSHFLASASHDLRQPLHALNLFIAQLENETDPEARAELVRRIDAAVGSMNDLFGSLLDMSRLEAGILEPQVSNFELRRVLEQVEATFHETARDKGLRTGRNADRGRGEQRPGAAGTDRHEPRLQRHPLHRRRGRRGRMPARGRSTAHRRRRHRTGHPARAPARRVHRVLSARRQLPGHRIRPRARHRRAPRAAAGSPAGTRFHPGRGSRFSVTVPRADAVDETAPTPAALADPVRGKLVIVIDDEPLVLDGMAGILGGWGCEVITADTTKAALAESRRRGQRPDLLICDYRPAGDGTGIEAIAWLRRELGADVPAFLISGDTAPSRLRHAREHGIHLLTKPVPPMQLRAMVNRLLAGGEQARTQRA
ncbi:MAG: response regulator [Gammaproteobacteria bacterium]|nr:response regulator [Gammaproteobacteria bacterium]